MGFKYEEFLNLTWKEYDFYSIGYARRLERQWDYTRHIIASNFNSSGFSKKTIKASDIIKLPSIDTIVIKKFERVSDDNMKKLIKILDKSNG